MKNYKTNKKTKIDCNYSQSNGLMYAIPIAFIAAIIPLIVRLKIVTLQGDSLLYWTGSNESADFFSYYKMIWFIIGATIAVVMMIIKLKRDNMQIKKTNVYIPIIVYSILAVFSTLLSNTKEIALYGFVDRYEGLFVLLGYMLILFIIINTVDTEKQIKFILHSIIVSASIIGIIGLFQFFGHDILQSKLGQLLTIPLKYKDYISKIKFATVANSIYSTLYHYNYLGSYMSMLFPLSIVLFFMSKGKRNKIITGLFSLLMFINWIACRSRAGVIGGTVALVIIFVVNRKRIFKNWKVVILLISSFAILFVGLDAVSNRTLSKKLKSLYTDPQNITQAEYIKDININNNILKIQSSKNNLNILYQDNQLFFANNENKYINTSYENGKIILKDEKYKQFQIYLTMDKNFNIIHVQVGNSSSEFIVYKGTFKIINHNGQAVDIKPVEKFGFEGKEKLGSSRGYIWSRSIPLLKDTIILGNGPDTFATSFPQDDCVGKILAYGTSKIVVDKPHNLYLQIALNTGVISLIALLVLFIGYIINSFKIYIRNDFNDFKSIIGFGIFAAVCGYLGSAFFNDSVISVAPVFWVLLGMGISINMALRETSKR